MPQVMTIGEVLVEIMAQRTGQTFLEPGLWEAPYPSGAPASFVSQAAQMGCTAGIMSCVGDDDFGLLNLRRLKTYGVDTSLIRVTSERPTGCAFVTYQPDGNRSFIFHIHNAACGLIQPEQLDNASLADCCCLHVMGSSLSIPGVAECVARALPQVRANAGKVSFDPNIRPELLTPAVQQQLNDILKETDIFLPSEMELPLFTNGIADVDKALDAVFASTGVSVIVVKMGSKGCLYADHKERFFQAAFPTIEVDPTGAGDCFAGAFIGAMLQGMSKQDAVSLACAAGASAVSIKGPMEGVATLAALQDRVRAHKQTLSAGSSE